jgi:hypothetical protein
VNEHILSWPVGCHGQCSALLEGGSHYRHVPQPGGRVDETARGASAPHARCLQSAAGASRGALAVHPAAAPRGRTCPVRRRRTRTRSRPCVCALTPSRARSAGRRGAGGCGRGAGGGRRPASTAERALPMGHRCVKKWGSGATHGGGGGGGKALTRIDRGMRDARSQRGPGRAGTASIRGRGHGSCSAGEHAGATTSQPRGGAGDLGFGKAATLESSPKARSKTGLDVSGWAS